MGPEELDKLAKTLENSGLYKTVKKFKRKVVYHSDGNENKLIGVYVDVETTGLSLARDKIIELGIVSFEFLPDGRVFKILDEYNEFEDPEMPLSQEIISLTGITDEMVKGHKLQPGIIEKIVSPASVIIAHNASFDRKFLEKRLQIFANKAWACSMNDVPWASEGIESSKLEYIAYKQGFFYEGHRAINDCFAGIHTLSLPLPKSKESTLKILLDNAREKEYRIWAEHSPFDLKETLKARGYRWNNGDGHRPKAWFIDIPSEKLKEEVAFLHNDIYHHEKELRIDVITAFNRYSDRI